MFQTNNLKQTNFINYQNGQPKNMKISNRQIKCYDNQLFIKIKAIGLNRAQCLQRQGKYPSSKQVQIQKYLGLEASGEIYDPNTNQKLYDGIALLSGGSYANWAVVPKTHIMPLPKNLSYVEGAAIPEAWLTAFQLLQLANLKQNNKVVIYAAASGVGTAVIQICSILKYKVYAVCSTEEKGKICKQLGVEGIAYYKDNENWANDLLAQNNQQTFDAVLDCVGSNNVNQTLKLLSIDGRWVLFGLLSGGKTQLNLAQLLAKRINVISTTLKTRSKQYKDKLINDFKQIILSSFDTGQIKPIIHQILKTDWKSADTFIKGHQIMQNNQNAGKIIIEYI